jgi:addiction module HigA family antidote
MKSLRSKNRPPTHPGEILREDILPELSITQTDLAKILGVSRRTISEILHERRPVSPDMAIRLARFTGTTAESWLNMQHQLDLWKLEQTQSKIYAKIKDFNTLKVAEAS